jgi:hypothetical protein
MPSHVPRSLEPYKKREQFEQRAAELRAAVTSGAGVERIACLAEQVRRAAFGFIKGRRHLVRGNDIARQLDNLQREEERWQGLGAEEIVKEVVQAPGPKGPG